MHPVIEHILQRKNKKPPFKDGRHITLAMFGGIMTGVRGGGAAIALNELGFTHSFDAVYTYSGGFPNASYFLSGQAELGTSVYYEELAGRKFINPFRIWDVADTERVVESVLRTKPLDVSALYKNKTKLYVSLWNTAKQKLLYDEIHNYKPSSYFKILRAAISVPYYHPGSIRIGSGHFKDYSPENYDDFLDYVYSTKTTDMLAIYNYAGQYIVPAIFSHKLFELFPKPEWPLSRLETDPKILKREMIKMKNLVLRTFNEAESL